MNGLKILIDTNILIGLEDNKEIASQFSLLHQKCQENNIKIYVHEASKKDIARDKDLARRQVILSKIDKFLPLNDIPVPNKEDLEKIYGEIKNQNDLVDVIFLHTLHNVNAVDFLVTQDRNLHKRARKIDIADRVFRVEDATVWLRNTFDKIPVSLPYIEDKQCHQLNRDDDIFNSLRNDYGGFDEWFIDSCVRKHRECWTIGFNDELAGIAIRKDESFSDLKDTLPSCSSYFIEQPDKILKICTFKIHEKYRGEKLGEQLIKQVLWWTNKNDYGLVYLSVFPKHKYLVDLLFQYGFMLIGRTDGELYLGKVFKPRVFQKPSENHPLGYHRQYYPNFLKGDNIKKYLIPIKGEYYETLFPENVSKKQRGLFDSGLGSHINKTPGNTIRKVYVCHAVINSISKGDILLFFHLKDDNSLHSQSLITVGIADGFDITSKSEELLKLTAKRSVFSPEKITEFTEGDKRKVKVVNFLLAGHINPAIFYDRMQDIGIKGPYQSIRSISNEHFKSLEKEIHFDVKTA